MTDTISTQRRGSTLPGMSASGVEAGMMSFVKSQRAGYHPRRSAHADASGGILECTSNH